MTNSAAPADRRADPARALEASFAEAAGRMAGLGLVNPALRVQAVGFAPWQSHWLGVLVTPWFMNLVLAPREGAQWRTLAPGGKRRFRFPAGEYEFIGARDSALGEFAMCSLFSPVLEFADHAQACEVATLALAALLDPRTAEDAEAPAAAGEVATPLGRRVAEPMSRRDLLRGRFLSREP